MGALPASYRPRGWMQEDIVITLKTADDREAAAGHARIPHEVEQRFAALRASQRTVTHKDAVAPTGIAYRGFAGSEDNPGPADVWLRVLEGNIQARRGAFDRAALVIGDEARKSASMEERLGPW